MVAFSFHVIIRWLCRRTYTFTAAFQTELLPPEEIVKKAHSSGLTAISITDHDTLDGIPDGIAAAEKCGIKIVPGIELTTDLPETEIHILGYYIDHNDAPFRELLSKIHKDREARISKIVDKLKQLGINIEVDEVMELVDSGSAGRPHVARVLVKKGVVGSIQEAFNKYLDLRSPAYVPHFRLNPIEAIKAIINAGGIPVYAHPAVSKKDEMIPELVAGGLAGIEVFYARHSFFQVKHYLSIAKKHNLLVTGGSDFHGLGTGRDIELGDLKLEDKYFNKLEEYAINAAARSNAG